MKKVVRGVIDPSGLQIYPAASILEAADEMTTLYHPFCDRTLSIVLRLWIHATSERSEKLNLLLADVQKQMMMDNTRGGFAIDTLEGSNRNVYLEAEGAEEAGMDIDYEISYRTRLVDPYAQS